MSTPFVWVRVQRGGISEVRKGCHTTFLKIVFTGPSLPKNHFIVAINWKGICFLDESEKRFLDLSFPEITGIHTNR